MSMMRAETPHYLADLLVPGHETWGGYRYAEYRRFFEDGTPNQTAILRDMRHIASLGFAPAFFSDVPLEEPLLARRTWQWTIPPTLREADPNAPAEQ